jgi:hypothetical protein
VELHTPEQRLSSIVTCDHHSLLLTSILVGIPDEMP